MRRSFVALVLAVTLPLPALAGQVTVKKGETLSEIAERHNISLSRLMQINGISNADQVEAGRTLTVPGRAATGTRTAAAGTVIVRPGETLSEIAERHGIGLSQLLQLNGLRNANQVQAGQTLRIRTAAVATSRPATTTTSASYPRGASQHVVRPGESLSVIADGYGIGMSKLIALNGISDPNLVEAGTRLKLKGTPPAPSAATRPAVTTATSSAAAQPAARPQAAATKPSPGTSTTPSTASAAPASRPAPAAASTTATPATSTNTTVAMASPDWRSYGPLQVNWSAWQPMGGSMVAPTLNGQGQTLYVAINCGARKLNATTSAGQWQSWDDPSADYEQQLVNDYCRARS